MDRSVRRNVYILIGLILCFTGVFMYKIEERARMHYELLYGNDYEENSISDNVNDDEKNIPELEDKDNKINEIDLSIKDDDEIVDTPSDSIFNYQKNSDWNLILINIKNTLEPDREVILEDIDGFKLDYRIIKEYNNMIQDARNAGVTLIMKSGYRSYETQKILYNNEVKEWMNKGYNQLDAMTYAAQIVAIPGTSEHQMGLAIDFITDDYKILEEGFDQTEAFKWLDENAYKYGFIMRYPKDKTNLTGIKYEPWHYRYLGREVAKVLKENNICLEELFNEPVNK